MGCFEPQGKGASRHQRTLTRPKNPQSTTGLIIITTITERGPQLTDPAIGWPSQGVEDVRCFSFQLLRALAHLDALSQIIRVFVPKGPRTNLMRTLDFYIGNHYYYRELLLLLLCFILVIIVITITTTIVIVVVIVVDMVSVPSTPHLCSWTLRFQYWVG